MIAKRSVRRALVIIYFFALFVIYPLLEDKSTTLVLFLFLSFSPISARGTELLRAYNGDFDFDERQKSLVKDAITTAYVLLAGLLLAVSAANVFLPYAPVWLQTLNDSLILGQLFTFRALLVLSLTLPPAVLMWLEPNPLPNESEPLTLTHPTLKS